MAKELLRQLRGKHDPRLTDRMEILLREAENEAAPLQQAMARASERRKFAVAQQAQEDIIACQKRFRKRLEVEHSSFHV